MSRQYGSDVRYPKGLAEFDRPIPSRPSLSKTASPRVGLDWPEEDSLPRKSLSPLLYTASTDRSLRLSDSSPAERRRLVNELRSEVRKVALKSSPPRRHIPQSSRPINRALGIDYDFIPSETASKRSFQASLYEDRNGAEMDFDERIPPAYHQRGARSTEEEAERELAELGRSTENLRRLGTDIMTTAAAYVSQVRLDQSFSGSRSDSGRSQYPYASRAENGVPSQASSTTPPAAAGMYAPSFMPAGIPAPQFYGVPPTFYQASPQPYSPFPPSSHLEAANHTHYHSSPSMNLPTGSAPGQQQTAVPGMPMYFSMPQPAYFIVQSPPYSPSTMAYQQQPFPPQFSPMHSTPVPPSNPATTTPQVQKPEPSPLPRSVNVPLKEDSKELSVTANSVVHEEPAEAFVVPSAPLPVDTFVPATDRGEPAVSFQPEQSDVRTAETDGYEPSGQIPADVPPAHVDLSALEEERKRRMKREFLARKEKDASSKAMANLATAAADVVKAKSGENDEKATSPPASTAAPTPRPVVIVPSVPAVEEKTAAQEPGSLGVTTEGKPEEKEEDDVERAARMQRLAAQAEQLKVDNSMAVVPFGVFLKNQTGGNGSYDNADLSSSFKSMRPPPVIGGVSTTPVGRRRARSDDNLDSGKSTNSAPLSVIPSLADRQPVMLQGYLMKTSGPKRPTQFRGTWQRRWFILSGRLLLYTASHSSSQVKRMLDLSKIDVVTENLPELDGAPTPHCIGLIEKGEPRMLTICADSNADILKWYKAIVLNCAVLCKNKVLQTTLPPVHKPKLSERDLMRKEMSMRFASQLPQPPAPEVGWFYPVWQKPKSYYDLLGVAPDATAGMIKKAYYKIAKDSHPDRSTRSIRNLEANPTKPAINPEEFAAVALAYETLIDPEKRSAYDLAERVKEELRQGIDCYYLECQWSDQDLQVEPRLRNIRKVIRRRITLFCDGEIRCLYWQPAPEPASPDEPAPLLPLCPAQERSIEMRFVQQILYFRDGPIDFGPNGPPPYENETRFVVMGDRLHTGPLLFEMRDHLYCTELVHGLRVARCEKSMLFQQKLESLKSQGIQ